MTGALYFPEMRVPESEWFTRTLLYWDDVATIVPREAQGEALQSSPYTQELVDNELVWLIQPEDYWQDLQAIFPVLIPHIDRLAEQLQDGLTPAWLPSGDYSHIHVGKVAHQLGEHLKEHRLAIPDPDPLRHEWLLVERRTASLVMSSLAIALATNSQRVPVTDRQSELDTLVQLDEQLSSHASRQVRGVRSVLIDALLPAPTRSISASSLRDFKLRHGPRLVSLRNYVDAVSIDIANVADPEFQSERLRLAKDEVADEVQSLAGEMRAKWRDIVFGPVCSLFATGAAFGAALASGQVPVALVGVPSLVNGIYTAVRAIDRERDWLQRPLAYAAFAQTTFGPERSP